MKYIIIAISSLLLNSCIKHEPIYEVYINNKYVKDVYHSSFTKKNCTKVENDYYCQNVIFKRKKELKR